MDTASLVNLIKFRLVPPCLITTKDERSYEGVNGSAVEILIVAARITVDNSRDEHVFESLRMLKRTMKCDVLLGRDGLGKLGFGLTVEGMTRARLRY